MGIRERREREREQRRESIVAAAKKVFLQKGIENTTMVDIAREAELSKAALYLYFNSKEELTFEMLYLSFIRIDQLIEAAARKGGNGYERLRHAEEDFKKFYREQPEYIFFTFILERHADSISRERPATVKCMRLIDKIQRRIMDLLEKGIEDGSVRPELDAEKTAVLFLHIVPIFMQRVSTMHKILGKHSIYEPDELVEEMFTVFLNSLH